MTGGEPSSVVDDAAGVKPGFERVASGLPSSAGGVKTKVEGDASSSVVEAPRVKAGIEVFVAEDAANGGDSAQGGIWPNISVLPGRLFSLIPCFKTATISS